MMEAKQQPMMIGVQAEELYSHYLALCDVEDARLHTTRRQINFGLLRNIDML
jgi:hypothetical protein